MNRKIRSDALDTIVSQIYVITQSFDKETADYILKSMANLAEASYALGYNRATPEDLDFGDWYCSQFPKGYKQEVNKISEMCEKGIVDTKLMTKATKTRYKLK